MTAFHTAGAIFKQKSSHHKPQMSSGVSGSRQSSTDIELQRGTDEEQSSTGANSRKAHENQTRPTRSNCQAQIQAKRPPPQANSSQHMPSTTTQQAQHGDRSTQSPPVGLTHLSRGPVEPVQQDPTRSTRMLPCQHASPTDTLTGCQKQGTAELPKSPHLNASRERSGLPACATLSAKVPSNDMAGDLKRLNNSTDKSTNGRAAETYRNARCFTPSRAEAASPGRSADPEVYVPVASKQRNRQPPQAAKATEEDGRPTLVTTVPFMIRLDCD
jgi:hypothetical protein